MRLYRESSWSPFPSYEQTIERERALVDENGECIVASIPRDDGEGPEGRPFDTKGVWTSVQPLHRTIYWLVQLANGALVSCTKTPQIQPQRAKSRKGGWVRERVANPMVSANGPGRDVAYLILGNYGGTMKGAANGYVLPLAAIAFTRERLIFLLIIRNWIRSSVN